MEVAFLPWAGLSTPIRLGRVELWPFWMERQSRIQQKNVLRYLERYLRCYRSDSGGNAAGPQVISTHADAPAFQPLTSRQRQEVRDAVNVLTLTSILPNIMMGVCTDNDSVAPPNSERYQLLFQLFDPTDKHIAVQSGNVLHGGVKIDSVRFAMPWSVGGELLGSPDTEVLNAFGKLLAQKRRRAETRRLFQSLDWFRFAHVGAEDTSSRSGKTVTPVTHTKAGWWMSAFYETRNAIAHGDAVDERVLRYGNRRISWLSHLIVGDLVFWECVLWQLFEQKLLGKGARRLAARFSKLCGQTCDVAFVKHVARSNLGFANYQEALGWVLK